MTEIIDRVAVAIWIARGDYPDSAIGVRTIWENAKGDLRAQAVAAIAAMREPTVKMTGRFVRTGGGAYGDVEAAAIWREMIDAALDGQARIEK